MATSFSNLKDNKWLTIVLIIAVVFIWGNVLFRVVEKPAARQVTEKKTDDFDRLKAKDSLDFTLSFKYEDPFALSATPHRQNLPAREPARQSKKTKATVKPTEAISYLGSIITASGNKKALIMYRSKYYYTSLNDTVGVYKLTSIKFDSVRFTSRSRTFWVEKNKKVYVH